jgi:thiol-disulfide isomerase/thioredoxin
MLTHLIFAALFFVSQPTAEAPFSDLKFDQALDAAKKDGKVVMIDFFTTWCVPCKKLDKLTWPDAGVQKWLGEKTVALKMDAEKEVELAKKYTIVSYPTILFLKPDGQELGRITAYKTPAEFLSEANDTLAGKDSVARAKEKLAAIQALEVRRDKAEAALLSGKGTRDDAAELCALNDQLGASEKTLALYERLEKEKLLTEEARGRMLDKVAEPLVEAKRFAELIQYGGDVAKRVDRDIEAFKTMAKLPPGRDAEERKALESTMAMLQADRVKKLSVWYAALLGTGQQERAGAVADKLIDFAPSGSTYVTLIDRAVHAGADGAARALADRGAKSLSDAEKSVVEAAAKLIPAKK